MKNNFLWIISVALTVFILSSIIITIHSASTLGDVIKIQESSILPAPVVTTSNDQSVVAQNPAQAEPTYTPINEQTAISLAQANTAVAVLSSQKAELVNLDGNTAYEVQFNLGKIYVDANTGSILNDSIMITPEIAANIASAYLHNASIIRVETAFLQGQNTYKALFSNGINIYIDMKGHIIFIENATNNGRVSRENDD